MTNPAYDLARTFIGTKEIPGPRDNPVIVDLAKTVGDEWVKDDETAWCGAFVGAMLVKSGLYTKDQVRAGTNGNPLGARNWLKFGRKISEPQEGDLVIFWRGDPNGWQGHVGFYVGTVRNGDIKVLGGNQSNSVSIETYKGERLLGYRRITTPAVVAPQESANTEKSQVKGPFLKLLKWFLNLFFNKGK